MDYDNNFELSHTTSLNDKDPETSSIPSTSSDKGVGEDSQLSAKRIGADNKNTYEHYNKGYFASAKAF